MNTNPGIFSEEERLDTLVVAGYVASRLRVVNWNVTNGRLVEERDSQNTFYIRKSKILLSYDRTSQDDKDRFIRAFEEQDQDYLALAEYVHNKSINCQE